jgi:hypothetical protein
MSDDWNAAVFAHGGSLRPMDGSIEVERVYADVEPVPAPPRPGASREHWR